MPPGRGEEERKVRGGRKGKREIVGDEVKGGEEVKPTSRWR